jgi:hypothetical protein
MKLAHKEVVRAFILEKLRTITRFDLMMLVDRCKDKDEELTDFQAAECFDAELYRIEKLFNSPPELPSPSPTQTEYKQS